MMEGPTTSNENSIEYFDEAITTTELSDQSSTREYDFKKSEKSAFLNQIFLIFMILKNQKNLIQKRSAMDPAVQRAKQVMRNILTTLQDMPVLTRFMIGHITRNRASKVNE